MCTNKKWLSEFPGGCFTMFLVVLGIIAVILTVIFRNDLSKEFIIAVIGGVFATMGYYIVHILEFSQKKKELKLEKYLLLAKSCRLFLNEPSENNPEKTEKIIDEFYNIYYQSTLLISSSAYEKFRKYEDAFTNWINKQEDVSLKNDFQVKQSDFLNSLREEFFPNDKIDFKVNYYFTHKKN